MSAVDIDTTADVVEPSSDRFTTLVAILIALVTVIGALVVWRAAVAEDASGDADYAGLRAAINAEETRALNFVNTYENYGSYVNYQRNRDFGNLILADMANATEEQALALNSQRADAHDLALAAQHLFPQRFLNRDGSYSTERQLNELWATAAKEKDLNPTPQFEDADRLRAKTNNLLLTAGALALALVAYTLIEAASARWKMVLFAAGSLLAIGGTIMAALIEFGA
jgi:hypothetical protein